MASEEIEMEMAEAILGIPFVFMAGEQTYQIHPLTLGKLVRLKPYVAALGMDDGAPLRAEALKACLSNPMAAACVIAIHTLAEPSDIKDRSIVQERAEELVKEMEVEDEVALLVHCLQLPMQADRLSEGTEIADDHKRRRRVMDCKSQHNTYYFGGRTLYGQLIDVACQRYGWSLDYVLWGISYTNLRMLIADQYSSMFLTDEEAKGCRVPSDTTDAIRADDPKNRDLLMQMFNQ